MSVQIKTYVTTLHAALRILEFISVSACSGRTGSGCHRCQEKLRSVNARETLNETAVFVSCRKVAEEAPATLPRGAGIAGPVFLFLLSAFLTVCISNVSHLVHKELTCIATNTATIRLYATPPRLFPPCMHPYQGCMYTCIPTKAVSAQDLKKGHVHSTRVRRNPPMSLW